MRVKFRDNLGSKDASKFSLDFRACAAGVLLDVTDELGAKLCQRGFAVEQVEEKPVRLKAVPPVDLQTSEPAAKPKGDKKPSV